MKEKIRVALLNKYKNLGFSDKAIDGVLAYLEQTVTEEDKIDGAVTAVEGMLKAFQSEVDTRVSTALAKPKPADPPKPQGDDPKPTDPPTPSETPEWAKGFLKSVETLTNEVTALKAGKAAESRKSQLETALKDAPEAYRTKVLKDYGRMSFKDDEEFNAYVEEQKSDSANFIQTEANNGLGKMGQPAKPAGQQTKQASKEEVQAVFGKPKS